MWWWIFCWIPAAKPQSSPVFSKSWIRSWIGRGSGRGSAGSWMDPVVDPSVVEWGPGMRSKCWLLVFSVFDNPGDPPWWDRQNRKIRWNPQIPSRPSLRRSWITAGRGSATLKTQGCLIYNSWPRTQHSPPILHSRPRKSRRSRPPKAADFFSCYFVFCTDVSWESK